MAGISGLTHSQIHHKQLLLNYDDQTQSLSLMSIQGIIGGNINQLPMIPTQVEVFMDFQSNQFAIESIIPTLLGGTLGLLALIGVRELLKETSMAFKKHIKA